MKRLITLFIVCLIATNAWPTSAFLQNPITPDLRQEMQKSPENELLRINIRLSAQYDAYGFLNNKGNMAPEQQRALFISELKSFSVQTQKGVMDELNYYSRSGGVRDIISIWINNVINCYATPTVIEYLANRDDIDRIDIDEERILLDPASKDNLTDERTELTREITWNVQKVNAPAVWGMGFNGTGIVVGVLDTGVNYNHNDLQGNMWTHPDYPFHGWNFTNNTNNPLDDHGHGTHCSGTVAGNGASGSQTGVAPGAKIMALKVLTSSGGGTESGVWQAIQFAIDNGAHVISLSLGWQHSWNPDRAAWRTAMISALNAGVVASVAAGNEGTQLGTYPIPDNVRTPGDCPPPWLHPDQTLTGGLTAVICIGATNSSDGMASFSSRGPVTWQSIAGYVDYAYNPGMGLIRPDVVAPGVNIKSLSHTSNSGYTNMDGTSMATPCAAGVMALMLSKNPNTTPAQISQILEETSVVLSPGKNNISGSGRIDGLAAVNATNFPGPVYHSHIFNDAAGNNDGNINPGESISLTLGMVNLGDGIFNNVSVTVSSDSPFITMIDNAEVYGNFISGDVVIIEDAFTFLVADIIPGGHAIKFNIASTDGNEVWTSSFIAQAFAPNLGSGNMTILDPSGNGNGILDPAETAILHIPVLNSGQLMAEDVQVILTTTSEWITGLPLSINIGNLQAGDQVFAQFPVEVSADAPAGENIIFTLMATSGAYTYTKNYILKLAALIEDFETGDFTKFNWTFTGNQPWTVVSLEPFEGSFSSKSGAIDNNQASRMLLTMNVAQNDSISFYFKVSSETSYDYFRFYIGNTQMGQWSGEVPWQRVAYAVTPGSKTFRWEYSKDVAVVAGSDCAWLDYISLPLPLITISYAGPDAAICENNTHQLTGHATNYTVLQWSTSGTGAFSAINILDPVYTPGVEDIAAGSVILTLTATNAANEQISDQMVLSISQLPEVFAGSDIAICASDVYTTITAEANHHNGLTWTSSGSGTFDDPSLLLATYLPSEADIAAGSVMLTLHAVGLAICDSDSSFFVLTLVPEISLSTGDDLEICRNNEVELNATVENQTSLLWQGSGTGTFSDVTLATTTYTPSEADLTAGTIELWLIAQGMAPCGEKTDTLTIVFLALPSAEMAGDATICQGLSTPITFTLTGSAPWSLVVGPDQQVIEVPESPYTYTVEPNETTLYALHSVSDANGCTIVDAGEVTITVNPLTATPEMPSGAESVDYAYNTSTVYTITASPNATNYQWEIAPASAGTLTPDGTSATIAWSSQYTGAVDITVKAINDCGESAFSEIKTVQLKNTTGIGNIDKPGNVTVYPNPSTGYYNIEVKSGKTQAIQLSVYDLTGRQVEVIPYNIHAGSTLIPLDLRTLDNGLYLLQIEHKEGRIIQKLIISR